MSMLEVMIAIAILLVISAISWEVLASTIEAREILSDRDETTRAARVTLARLRREIQLAFLTKQTQAINTYATVFVGVDDTPDRLYFSTFAHQRLYRDSRESDQTEVTVWCERITSKGEGCVLFHREAPRIDEEPDEEGPIYPIAYNVLRFDLRYLDSRTNEWVDEWDSRSVDFSNRIPRAVEIGLVLAGRDPRDEERTIEVPFLSTVSLEYADPLPRSLLQAVQ
jgi:general secretion pathway protein J